MFEYNIAIPYMDKFFDLLFIVLAPVISIVYFILIFGVSFVFIAIFLKSFILAKIFYNVFRDFWVKYNYEMLGLLQYKDIPPNYTYDTKGLTEILELFKGVTRIF